MLQKVLHDAITLPNAAARSLSASAHWIWVNVSAREQTATATWHAMLPLEAAMLLASVPTPWWVAGGWALDLFVGGQTRGHGDLDIGLLRRDVRQLTSTLSSWEFFEAKNGLLSRLEAGREPNPGVNSLWCRAVGAMSWTMQVLLDASDHEFWVFRRQAQIRRPLAEVIRRNPQSIPYLAPEVQLLYKARSMRPRDRADFGCVAPRLDCAARTWLRRSLSTVDPEHEWISALEGPSRP